MKYGPKYLLNVGMPKSYFKRQNLACIAISRHEGEENKTKPDLEQ